MEVDLSLVNVKLLTSNSLSSNDMYRCPAVLKCSEVTTHTGALLANLIPMYLDQDAYAVVLGEVDVITRLLEMQWGQ